MVLIFEMRSIQEEWWSNGNIINIKKAYLLYVSNLRAETLP